MAKKKSSPKSKARKRTSKSSRTKTPRPSLLWRMVRTAFLLTVALFVCGVLALSALFYVFSLDLPDIFERDDFQPIQITRIYSSEGHLLDELYAPEGRRSVVAFDAIAKPMRDAILAAEDADFYKHQGLDYYGMVRALYYAFRYNRRQGASTITQQVVKNLILTPERTIKRKIQEIMLARRLEEHLTKDDILYIYLNQIYFGHGNYGVQEASRAFFGKNVSELTLAEAALLAGVVQSPERLSPRKHPKRSTERRRYVLEQMWKKGFVEEHAAKAAMKAPIVLAQDRGQRKPWLKSAPYYTAHVLKVLEKKFPDKPLDTLGWSVKTTLKVERQRDAQNALKKGLEAFDAKKKAYRPIKRLKNKALSKERARAAKEAGAEISPSRVYNGVVLKVGSTSLRVAVGTIEGDLFLPTTGRANPTGKPLKELFAPGDLIAVMPAKNYVRGASEAQFRFASGAQGSVVSIDVKTRRVEALVGGYDFEESNFNRATQALRQTGSAFKPFVYGAALADKISTPATVWLDTPKPFSLPDGKTWSPRNADGKFKGPLLMRRALALSRNVIAVRILERVTIPRVQRFAKSLGIDTKLVNNYTMGLGSSEMSVLELSSAYTNLAALGRTSKPVFVLSVHDSFGRTIYNNERRSAQTVPPEIAWLLVDVMTSVLSEGTASKIGKRFGRPAAGKTGTTNHSRDALFVGFTPSTCTGVWVGHDNNTPLGRGASGGSTAAPIWLDVMKAAHKGVPPATFTKPPVGLVEARIDPKTGLLAPKSHSKARREFFLTGTAPTEFAPAEDEASPSDFLLGQGSDED